MAIKAGFFDTKGYDREAFLQSEAGRDIDWQFFEFRLNPDTAAILQGCRAVCVFVNDRLDSECIGLLQEAGIELIALRCAGFNNVDLPAARERGIRVTRVPAYSPHAVAEHTLALLLCLNRKIHRAFNRVREHNFSLNGLVGFDLYGKTVGIIGTGKIGRITAELFRGFGTQVLATDPFADHGWAESCQVRYVEMNELLRESDIVSLHLPLTSETYRLINGENLSRMKKGAYLINTGRGKLIDTGALIGALKAEHLGGVALDV